MRRWGKGVAIATLVGGFVGIGAAYAQDDAGNIPGAPHQLRLSAGAMFSNQSHGNDEGSDSWGLLSVSFDLRRPSPSRFLDLAAYVDVGYAPSRHTTYEDDFRKAYHNFDRSFYGLGLQARVRLTPSTQRFGIYATGGVGIYNVARDESDTIEYQYDGYYDDDGNYQDGTVSHTRDHHTRNSLGLGYKFGMGGSFGRGLFVEMNYYNAGKLEDFRYSGVGVTFGLRL